MTALPMPPMQVVAATDAGVPCVVGEGATSPRSRMLARLVMALALVTGIAVDGLLWHLAAVEYDAAAQNARSDLEDTARLNVHVLDNDLAQVSRIFTGINAELLRYFPSQIPDNAEILAFLYRQLSLLPMSGDIVVTDSAGGTLFWTGLASASPAVAKTPYFEESTQRRKGRTALGKLHLERGAGGQVIVVSQRLNDIFGGFIGMVALRVQPATLGSKLMAHGDISGAVALVAMQQSPGDTEPTVIAQAPPDPQLVGLTLSQAAANTAVAMQQTVVSRDFGLDVTTLVDSSSIFVDWQRHNVYRWISGIFATMLLGGIAFYAVRQADALNRAFNELKELSESLQTANAAKSNFLANMSHELRTPLNAIIGFSEALLSGCFGNLQPPKSREYLGDIHSSGRLLLSLVNDILDLAKIDTGKFDILRDPIDLVDVCRDCLKLVEATASARRIVLDVALPSAPAIIDGDPRRLKQALINLLINAIRYNRDAGLASLSLARDGRQYVIVIADKGIGMSADELRSAFMRFGHSPSTTTTRHGGTGLGLPIARGIIESHGGTLAVDSEAEHGTRVEIRLPAHMPVEQTPERDSHDQNRIA